MKQPITVADSITYGEYDQLVQGWERAHEDPDAVDAPDPEWWQEQQERITANPHLTGHC